MEPAKFSESEVEIAKALKAHWAASSAGDQEAEHAIYAEDAICDYPQSGERIHGRHNLQALRAHHPGKPAGFQVRRMTGSGEFWVTEYVIEYEGQAYYTVSIMEFRDGKVCRETQYFGEPFAAPEWRAQWVERVPELIDATL
ncbi:MAG: nuclear transport factor 2 family protein [Verrucomicrobia bacterium]|nr:nuclear transport factor 2 family protein [Verrucomicrobiota bacterium]